MEEKLREEEEYYARSHDEASSKLLDMWLGFSLSSVYQTCIKLKNNPCILNAFSFMHPA